MADQIIPLVTTELGDLQKKARDLVHEYIIDLSSRVDRNSAFDVYVVWFCKILRNWKALVSTTLPDGMYYEITYNGETGETYLDAYKKFDNVCYPSDDIPTRALSD